MYFYSRERSAHPAGRARSERSRGRAAADHRANRDLPVGSLLVTGGCSAMGSALLREIGDLQPTALVHHEANAMPAGQLLHCDFTAPRLGLTQGEHHLLARGTRAVVFCAADAHPIEPVLELCELARARLYYVSTALNERASALRVAERAVRTSGLAATIVRPSTVIGDSASGAITEFSELHALAGALVQGRLALLPLEPRDLIDFVPRDVAARALARLVRAGEAGGERWLTAGRRALPVHRVVRACIAMGRELGLAPRTPRFVSRPLVDRLVRPASVDGSAPVEARRRLDEVLDMTAKLAVATPLPSSLSTLPDLELALEAALRCWATRNRLAPVVRS